MFLNFIFAYIFFHEVNDEKICLADDMCMAMRHPFACSFPRSDHLITKFSRDAHDFGYIVDVILMNIKHFDKWTHNLL
jgi:hypothetical protein